jgi:uncharacterized C2H2 Zn-finger protein
MIKFMEMNSALTKIEKNDGWEFVHNEIVNRIGELYIDCPECESIDDEQYACQTCGGYPLGKLNVLTYLLKNNK